MPKSHGKIPQPEVKQFDDSLVFSFKHLDLATNPKFTLDRCREGYLSKLLERLKALHGFKVSELKHNKSKSLRCHSLDWNATTEPGGFRCLNDQLRSLPAWQFEVSSNEHGRVHGFFIDQTFFVVWVDPEHRLYQ
ncbi:hypothetical protein IRI77_30170 [Paludibaculum fermentans]|uniref:Uncharacterized protein n=1 Tax=Paludibaculum fermentans TaxID=1473598 RepID=A0A7S7SPS6_PALFE|nr:hypothetical protein IRI77_30170 [Paludibaculum fermentans]